MQFIIDLFSLTPSYPQDALKYRNIAIIISLVISIYIGIKLPIKKTISVVLLLLLIALAMSNNQFHQKYIVSFNHTPKNFYFEPILCRKLDNHKKALGWNQDLEIFDFLNIVDSAECSNGRTLTTLFSVLLSSSFSFIFSTIIILFIRWLKMSQNLNFKLKLNLRQSSGSEGEINIDIANEKTVPEADTHGSQDKTSDYPKDVSPIHTIDSLKKDDIDTLLTKVSKHINAEKTYHPKWDGMIFKNYLCERTKKIKNEFEKGFKNGDQPHRVNYALSSFNQLSNKTLHYERVIELFQWVSELMDEPLIQTFKGFVIYYNKYGKNGILSDAEKNKVLSIKLRDYFPNSTIGS